MTEIDDICSRLKAGSRYFVFQRERCPTTGREHLQGYVQAVDQLSLRQWKQLFGENYPVRIAKSKGDYKANRVYCTKEETRIEGTEFTEFGQASEKGKRNDIHGVLGLATSGADLQEVITEYPEEWLKYSKAILAARGIFSSKRTAKPEVFWFYGPTGSGKSFTAFQMYPNAYFKDPTNKWWDNYDGYAPVIIDDFRRDFCTFAQLLRLLDRYPLRVEFKGGSTEFCASAIVITTPKSPKDTWEGRTEEDLQQLLRRIDHIRYFPAMFAGCYRGCLDGVGTEADRADDSEGDLGGPDDELARVAWDDIPKMVEDLAKEKVLSTQEIEDVILDLDVNDLDEVVEEPAKISYPNSSSKDFVFACDSVFLKD